MASVSRRDTLKRLGGAALVAGGTAAVGRALWSPGSTAAVEPARRSQLRDFRVDEPSPEAVAFAVATHRASSGSPPSKAELVRRALRALGSMKRFVTSGDVVAIKPNIGWDRTPAHAANTNPEVVAELVRQTLDAGAKRVVVTDVSCNDPQRSFQRSGIWKAAHDAGATVVLPAKHRFRTIRLGGELLDEWPVFAPVLDADKVINVPVAKQHGLAQLTCALKNWYGLLGGRRNRLHQDIDVSIADLASFIQPTLTVVDGTRVLVRNGPQGGNLADTKDTHTVVASTDQVAADAYSCRLIGITPQSVGYLRVAQQRGLGTMNWEKLPKAEV